MKVSAIVSTFNSSNFIHGCLEDLVNQTLYKKGELEIMVIDSGSNENEVEIVEKFQKKYSFIKYHRTEERESLYMAWNKAIKKTTGEYLTNANTDDRHDFRSIEYLVTHLEKNPDRDIAYGNLYKSHIANESFDKNDKSKPCVSQKFFPGSLLLHNYLGAQPLWRRSVHDKIGNFDENYEVMGDYEFVLRAISHGCKLSYVPNAEGLMLWHKNALSTKDSTAHKERDFLLRKYRSANQIKKIYHKSNDSNQKDTLEEAFLDLGLRSLCYYPQFLNNSPMFDLNFARNCFEFNPKHKIFRYNLTSLSLIQDFKNLPDSSHNESNLLKFYGNFQSSPTEYELKNTQSSYFYRTDTVEIGKKCWQTYNFDITKFQEIFFGHLPIRSLNENNEIFIWGYNPRGKFLKNLLEKTYKRKINLIDSAFEFYNQNLSSLNNNFISFEEIEESSGNIFFLAMSSHHWSEIEEKIKSKFPKASIFRIDRA
tara:strand:- start:5841 stop:7280 length:1440 start_codon:yes stop_codon:yes gene_type:complete